MLRGKVHTLDIQENALWLLSCIAAENVPEVLKFLTIIQEPKLEIKSELEVGWMVSELGFYSDIKTIPFLHQIAAAWLLMQQHKMWFMLIVLWSQHHLFLCQLNIYQVRLQGSTRSTFLKASETWWKYIWQNLVWVLISTYQKIILKNKAPFDWLGSSQPLHYFYYYKKKKKKGGGGRQV